MSSENQEWPGKTFPLISENLECTGKRFPSTSENMECLGKTLPSTSENVEYRGNIFPMASENRERGKSVRTRRPHSLLLLRPGILEGDGAVEDGFRAGLVVLGIGHEIADAFELAGEAGFAGSERGFHLGGETC